MIFAPYPKAADPTALIALWMEAFGEEKEEVLPFFRDIYPLCQAWTCMEGETLCAMAYALPHTLVTGKTHLPAAYLYAVATKKEYRGRGLASRLLGEMEAALKEAGIAGLLLVPANAELFAFYGKLGMQPFSYRGWQTVTAKPGTVRAVPAAEYAEKREAYLEARPHNLPPVQVLERYGLYAWETGICAVEKTPQGARFREILGDPAGAGAVLAHLGEAEGRAHLPAGDTAYAVAKPLCKQFPREGYFAFAME